MFKKRYEPKIKGETVTIRDGRLRHNYSGLILLAFFIPFFVALLLLVVTDDYDLIDDNFIICIWAILTVVLIFVATGIERKYVMDPKSISITRLHGILRKRIEYHSVEQCFCSDLNIALTDDKGKMYIIEFATIASNRLFTKKLKRANVKIYGNHCNYCNVENTANYKYHFTMKQKDGSFGVRILVIIICAFWDYFIFEMRLPNIMLCAFFTFGAFLLLVHTSYIFRVDDDLIEIRRWFRKTRIINVNDISEIQYNSEYSSSSGYLEVSVGNETVINKTMHVGYDRYDDKYFLFKDYLRDKAFHVYIRGKSYKK